jgi:hypothetical protein
LAGPPVHSPLPDPFSLDNTKIPVQETPGGDLNKACGAAVDTKGDLYVASAGKSYIDIFKPTGDEAHPWEYLTSIPNANEPCGLAVDTNGNLYVSEKAVGDIVKYEPSEYPFTGTPTYSLVSPPIDESHQAQGIAVDPTDNRLYVAEGDRVDSYTAAGSAGPTIGLGDLSEATGVAIYTSLSDEIHYLTVADHDGDVLKIFSGPNLSELQLRRVIDGSNADEFTADETPANGMEFGPMGAAAAADWTNGHVFVYDAAHSVVNEFEATGEYVSQISDTGFVDAEPTAVAIAGQRNEVQRLVVNATTGTYKLCFDPDEGGPEASDCTEPPLPYNATSAQIQAELGDLPSIGPGNIAVSGAYTDGLISGTYSVSFIKALGNRDVTQLVPDDSGLGSGSASVTTQAPGTGPGRVYVTTGAVAGARLHAFAPLASASRPPHPKLSLTLGNANSVTVDAFGNRYVAAGASIKVYQSDSNIEIATIPNAGKAYDLAVDSACNVYALNHNSSLNGETVVYLTPSSCPPKNGTTYGGPTTVATTNPPYFPATGFLNSIGIDPTTDQVYVNHVASSTQEKRTIILDSAAGGSEIVDPDWAPGLFGVREELEPYGANGNVYVSSSNGTVIYIANSAGTRILGRITGKGGPNGFFVPHTTFAVDQTNGHVVTFANTRGVIEEYEASGAFVAESGSFTKTGAVQEYRVALDSSGAPLSDGNAYVAFDDPGPETFDLTAFGPLSYGEPPIVVTGLASAIGVGNATLNGTVDPRDFPVTDCHFDYQNEAEVSPPTWSHSIPCAETSEQIGSGTGAIPVHADLTLLDPEERYRFRLVATNEFGTAEGDPGLFGPPLLTTRTALPILYTEATLRAEVDPSGLATTYRFQYGTSESYEHSTPVAELQPADGPVAVEAALSGLSEGTEYRFRIVAENEAGTKVVEGEPEQTFITLERLKTPLCPNAEYRTGLSTGLPDCRVYELVTPADTAGMTPEAANTATHQFNNWLVTPHDEAAGDRLSYFVDGTLAGFDGNGTRDGYRAQRAPGAHPSDGWSSELFSPSYLEAAVDLNHPAIQEGIASDQQYSLWKVRPIEGSLATGAYLRTPGNFEPLGQGSLGTDLDAFSHYVSAGGAHVIFSSEAHLEPGAPAAPTNAIYDRAAGVPRAEVVSLPPSPPAEPSPTEEEEYEDIQEEFETMNATYLGSTEDGRAVAFEVGGVLYLRRNNEETIQVTPGPSTFAGVSEEGDRVFYAATVSTASGIPDPATLYTCDANAGRCVGGGAPPGQTVIAPESVFVNVSADGSNAFFVSEKALTGSEENESGEVAEEGRHNLYAWEVGSQATSFISQLDGRDFVSFDGLINIRLDAWSRAIRMGRGNAPTRSTSDGDVFVFQSHAQLTGYDNEGRVEIYRYDPAAARGEQLICVSCDPSGAPPSGGSRLQDLRLGSAPQSTTLIPNVTEDGDAVFFGSDDQLLPEDANDVADVYEWRAQGIGGCKRLDGCLALISSGQGDRDNFLYSMTPDGHDVFFSTLQKLVGADITGSPSIYDARVEGGIPDPPAAAPCQGDACQGQGSTPPALPAPTSTGLGEGNVREAAPKTRCAKGKRKVRRNGKTRCVKKHSKKRRHNKRRRANHSRRAGR